MKEAYIRFMASVNDQTMNSLCSLVDSAITNEYERIHLMIASTGGGIHAGLDAYNLLKQSPIEIYTYNMGHVESIAVILFCIGDKRFSCEHARFMIHEGEWCFSLIESLTASKMEKRVEDLKTNQNTIIDILAKTANKSNGFFEEMAKKITYFTPQQAKDYGIVTDMVTEPFIQKGAQIFAVTDPPQLQQQKSENKETVFSPSGLSGQCRIFYENPARKAIIGTGRDAKNGYCFY